MPRPIAAKYIHKIFRGGKKKNQFTRLGNVDLRTLSLGALVIMLGCSHLGIHTTFQTKGPHFQVVPGPAHIVWSVLAVLSRGRFARKAESGRQGPALTAAPCLLTKHVAGVLT